MEEEYVVILHMREHRVGNVCCLRSTKSVASHSFGFSISIIPPIQSEFVGPIVETRADWFGLFRIFRMAAVPCLIAVQVADCSVFCASCQHDISWFR